MPTELPDTPARRTYLALIQLHEALTAEFGALFKRHGLSLTWFNALRVLVQAPAAGLSCQALGERLVHRVPDVTRLVDRMERAGLVERRRSTEDRRVVLVRATRKGRAACEGVYGEVADLHERQFAALDEARQVELDAALRTVLADAREREGR